MTRRFVVKMIEGHNDMVRLRHDLDLDAEVTVTAVNETGDQYRFRYSLANQPNVGDIITLDDGLPEPW